MSKNNLEYFMWGLLSGVLLCLIILPLSGCSPKPVIQTERKLTEPSKSFSSSSQVSVVLEISEAPKLIYKDGKCYRILLGSNLTDLSMSSYTDLILHDSTDVIVFLPCFKINVPMVMK